MTLEEEPFYRGAIAAHAEIEAQQKKARIERAAIAIAPALVPPDLVKSWYSMGGSGEIANALEGVASLSRLLAEQLIGELDRDR